MPSSHRPNSWLSLLLESFFVVLGVVLALGANEWREARQRDAHAQQALASIQEELQTNRTAITQALDYHLYLADTLSTLARYNHRANHEPVYPQANLFNRGYVHPTTLVYTAWETAQATNAIETMDFDLLLSISRMYENQKRYDDQGQMVGAQIYQTLFTEGRHGILRNYENHLSILSTFWYRECTLLQDYSAVLEQLGAEEEPALLPTICTRALSATER